MGEGERKKYWAAEAAAGWCWRVDAGLPNGGGALSGEKWAQCKAFPASADDRGVL